MDQELASYLDERFRETTTSRFGLNRAKES